MLILVAFDLMIVLVVTWVLYVEKKQSLIADIDNTLRSVATMGRALFPPDYHDRIEGPGTVTDEAFQAIVDRNNKLCVALGLEYIWSLMLVDGKTVFTSATSPDKVVGNRRHAKFFEAHSNPELYAKAFDTMAPTFRTIHDKWGNMRVVLLPDIDRRGRKFLFAASISLERVNRKLMRGGGQSLAMGVVLFFGNVFVILWISHVVTRPIKRLTATIQAIAAGQDGGVADEVGTYEVQTLAHHFNRLNRELHDKISGLEASHVRLIDQHAEASKQARDDLDSSEKRYKGLLNFAVDGILIGTNKGVITEVNECMCSLFGLERQEIIGKHINQMPFSEDDFINNPFRFDLVRAGQRIVRERTIQRADGSAVVVEIHSKMMSDGMLQSIYHDITERKRVEHSLHEAYVLLEDAQRLAKLGGWKYDLTTCRAKWTDVAYNIFGVGPDFDINDPEKLIGLLTPEFRPVLSRAWQRAVEFGEPYQLEMEHVLPATREHGWVCVSTVAIFENGRVTGLTGNVLDITDRKRAQEVLEFMNLTLERRVADRTAEVQRYADQLRELTARLIRAEESERQRMTHVLHEDLQQGLVAARMTLEVASQMDIDGKIQDALSRADSMLSRSIQLMRTLVREIAVPAVKEGNLPDAVRWLAHEMKEKFGLTVNLTVDNGLEPVSENVYLCLYRAIQEILFNVVKHAKVSHAEVILQKEDARLVRVTIKDGGQGFPLDAMMSVKNSDQGIGLFGIRQRVEGLGGRMHIYSSKGNGTSIVIVLPIRDGL